MLGPMQPQQYMVARTRREMTDTYTLDLIPADGSPSIPFAPGQFNMLYAFGIGEVPISISGYPADGNGWAHTIRSVGAVTRALSRMKKGQVVGLRGPFGTSWPVEQALNPDILLVAGGIGLAPLRPAIQSVIERRSEFNTATLLYGSRSPREMLYSRQLSRWRRGGVDILNTVDRADEGWEGEVGVVTKLISRALPDPGKTTALVCGPEIMMRFTVAELEKLGVPEEQIFVSMERNMECALGHCGHCQLGPHFVCKDGPVFQYSNIKPFFWTREV